MSVYVTEGEQPPQVTEEVIDILVMIEISSVTYHVPFINAPDYKSFKDTVGSKDGKSSKTWTNGCYILITSTHVYIGQSNNISRRLGAHLRGDDKNEVGRGITIGDLRNTITSKVLIFTITQDIVDQYTILGWSDHQFRCLLEQYLFFRYQPNANIIKWSGAKAGSDLHIISIKEKHDVKTRTLWCTWRHAIFFYWQTAEGWVLFYIASSQAEVARDVGRAKSWVPDVFRSSGGWVKKTFLITTSPIEGAIVNIMDVTQFKTYVATVIKPYTGHLKTKA